ncbi:MAG: MATE family efflux transporter [Clostridia bacterium]|nr:MATE family efflux transporter [Clostridia bacterium]
MKTNEVFDSMPVRKAVITMAVPTVLSQLIHVLYNMADTFFIGQLNDPAQVAAATLSMPPFLFLTGFANLFGIGGASVISRMMGQGRTDRARRCAAFSIWGGVTVSLVYALAILLFRKQLLPLIGTNETTYPLVYQYLLWTTVIGAVPTVMNTLLSHLVRTEGRSRSASFGIMLGCILNIVLDPLFIFGFHLDILGAAVATMVSNFIAMMYFVIIITRNRETVISLHPRHFTLGERIPSEILVTGFPSFLMVLMSFFSNTFLNSLVSGYSNEAMAGMGIAKKVDMVGFAIAQGMTQGVLALIGYNYAAGNRRRMQDTIRLTLIYSTGVAAVFSAALFLFASPIARMFIQNEETVAYGQRFIRVMCVTCPAASVTMMAVTVFQATGEKLKPMLISMLRKGGLDIPFMLLYNALLGVEGIAFATPTADLLTMTISILLILPYWRKLMRRSGKNPT